MSRIRSFVWIGGLCLVAVFTVRLAWIAGQTPDGAHYLWMQWRPATLGRLVAREIPIASRMPADQADFWLAETGHVAGSKPTDAHLAIGAAILLDRHGDDFWQPYSTGAFGVSVPDATQPFEDACRDRCLQFARQAVNLEPNNVHWRRLQALLLIRATSYWGGERRPLARTDDWKSILDECAEHDPDNALYPYVAAILYWDLSFDDPPDEATPTIIDQATYDLGVEQFEQGLTLPLKTSAAEWGEAKLAFLERSDVPPSDQVRVLTNEPLENRLYFLYRRLQERRGAPKLTAWDAASSALPASEQQQRLPTVKEEARKAIVRLQTAAQLREQWESTQAALADLSLWYSNNEEVAYLLLDAVTAHPNLLSSEDAERLLELYAGEVRRNAIHFQFPRGSNANSPGQQIANLRQYFAASALAIATALLMLIAVSGFVSGRMLRDSPAPIAGPLVSLVCLVIAATAIFAIYGMGTAYMIRQSTLSLTLSGLLFAIPVAAAIGAAIYGVRKYGSPLSRIQFLLLAFGVGLALRFIVPATVDYNAWVNWLSTWGTPSQRPLFDHWLQLLEWNSDWDEAWAQWLAHSGSALTIVAWATLLAVAAWTIAWIRSSNESPLTLKSTCGAIACTLSRRSAELALLAAIAYLLAAPQTLATAEAERQHWRQTAVDPAAHLRTKLDQIQADPAAMRQIRQYMTSNVDLVRRRLNAQPDAGEVE